MKFSQKYYIKEQKVFIKSIEVKLANGFEKTLSFTKPIIIIRAPNATGKSVLLSLLDTNAITKSFLFTKSETRGASSEKTVTVEKDGVEFILSSKVNKTKTTCSFKIDGIEKCTNGLVTTYNNLLSQYDIHTLPLIDQKTSMFFDLSPVKRKEYVQDRFVEGIGEINEFRSFVKEKHKELKAQSTIFFSKILAGTDKVILEEHLVDIEARLSRHVSATAVFNKTNNDYRVLSNSRSVEVQPIAIRAPESLPFSRDNAIAELRMLENKSQELTLALNLYYQSSATITSYSTAKTALDNFIVQLLPNQEEILATISISELHAFKRLNTSIDAVSAYCVTFDHTSATESFPFVQTEISEITNKQKILVDRTSQNNGEKKTLTELLHKSQTENSTCIVIDTECVVGIQDRLKKLDTEISVDANLVSELTIKLGTLTASVVAFDKYTVLKEQMEAFAAAIPKTVHAEQIKTSVDSLILSSSQFTAVKLAVPTKPEAMTATAPPTQDDIDSVNTKIEFVKGLIQYYDDLIVYDTYKTAADSLNDRLTQYKKELALLETSLETDVEYLETTIDTTKHKLTGNTEALKWVEDNTTVIETTETLAKILDVNGLPKFLSLGKLMVLESRINDIIHSNFTAGLTLRFSYTEKKFEIHIETSTSVNTFESLSGYETSVIKMCTALAISDETKDILRLDEVDATFDSSNRYLFSTFLGSLLESKLTRQIFVISHNAEFDSSSLQAQEVRL